MEKDIPTDSVKGELSIQGTVPAITREILESYLNCQYKGHLKLIGQTGTPSDYEVLMEEIKSESLKSAEVKLAVRYGEGEPTIPLRGVTHHCPTSRSTCSLTLFTGSCWLPSSRRCTTPGS
jgi:hypothetical protein